MWCDEKAWRIYPTLRLRLLTYSFRLSTMSIKRLNLINCQNLMTLLETWMYHKIVDEFIAGFIILRMRFKCFENCSQNWRNVLITEPNCQDERNAQNSYLAGLVRVQTSWCAGPNKTRNYMAKRFLILTRCVNYRLVT